jgi:hypothetical protein
MTHPRQRHSLRTAPRRTPVPLPAGTQPRDADRDKTCGGDVKRSPPLISSPPHLPASLVPPTHPSKPAMRFIASARIAVLYANESTEWTSTARRMVLLTTVTSDTWKHIPTVNEKYAKSK